MWPNCIAAVVGVLTMLYEKPTMWSVPFKSGIVILWNWPICYSDIRSLVCGSHLLHVQVMSIVHGLSYTITIIVWKKEGCSQSQCRLELLTSASLFKSVVVCIADITMSLPLTKLILNAGRQKRRLQKSDTLVILPRLLLFGMWCSQSWYILSLFDYSRWTRKITYYTFKK